MAIEQQIEQVETALIEVKGQFQEKGDMKEAMRLLVEAVSVLEEEVIENAE